MPINAGYEYFAAEKAYHEATTMEDKIEKLEELIRSAPKHKSSENLNAGLKLRLKKLKESNEKQKKSGKSSHKSIKKEGFQIALIGFPNSGTSSLLKTLTNANPIISEIPFTTRTPEVGMMLHEGIKAQIVDIPSIGSERFDQNITNTANMILIVIEKLDEIEKVQPFIKKATGQKIIVINKSDLLSENELRKLEATLKAKRIQGVIISTYSGYHLKELKDMIISKMHVIRVYTKEPGKPSTKIPMVLPEGSTLKDIAESILKGFSKKVKETRITGPSSKFANQKVGLTHILKDKDIVEFHTN
ncbi:MAG: GTPase [Nanoarchaeota archaeon]